MSFFVQLGLPGDLKPEARDSLAEIVTRLASRFSFEGLEDWSVDVKNSRVLGAEAEFQDLSRAGAKKPEMRVYFAERAHAATFARILAAAFADLKVSGARRLAPKDWMKLWRRHYKTQTLREGKRALHIVPAWKKRPRGGASVRITPGQAFGTGTHPTTQLCLRLFMRHAADAKRVLDFGAGTGVLLIAASKLSGAGGLAVESDAVALAQCRKNAKLNRSSGLRFSRKMGSGKFDLVFANVLAPVLLGHRESLVRALKPGALIFLSGILGKEAGSFLRKFRTRQLAFVERLDQGDWSAIALRRLE
ncbi:MAG: 50S ribosomal protein L11 methyltransferase [Bdellovibrionota bacterium]